MNIEQLKRNNLDKDGNAAYFARDLMSKGFRFGPATMAEFLTEAFLSDDESFSAQVWFSVLSFLPKFNVEYDKDNLSDVAFSENERVQSYRRLIERIFKLFNDESTPLAFFINHRKWSRKILNELSPQWKAIIYATDAYFYKVMKDVGYVSLKDLLKDESLSVKTMAEGYFAFIYKGGKK